MKNIPLLLILQIITIFSFGANGHKLLAVNNATIESVSIPQAANVGEQISVTVTVTNTGETTWTSADNYRLGSENPRDNNKWGFNRINLRVDDQIAPGEQKVFTFNARAPYRPGTHEFQVMMVQDGVNWFGTTSQPVSVSVSDDPSINQLNKKLMMGYQGWFLTEPDNSPPNEWRHWFNSGGYHNPIADEYGADMWPDMSEYSQTYNTQMTYADGSSASLFSSVDLATTKKHFEWLKDYNVHGVYLQRFLREVRLDDRFLKVRDTVLKNVIHAAQEHDRKFAIMYDLSNLADNPFDLSDAIAADWEHLEASFDLLNNGQYVHQHNKPVIAIWGIGFPDRNLVRTELEQIITYFKNRGDGMYVIGGVPSGWRTLSGDSETDPEWADVYASLDMISPWTVGRYATDPNANWQTQVDNWKNNKISPDLATCESREQDYMPVIWPGFSSKNIHPEKPYNEVPRRAGEFYWRQAYNVIEAGADFVYVAMFDEVDEGTAMFKTAETKDDVPVALKNKIITNDEDGTFVPNDWYLKLADQTQLMLDGTNSLSATIPITPSQPEPSVDNADDYHFLTEITDLLGDHTGWQDLTYTGSTVGTTEFLIVSFSHGNPACDQMIHIGKHDVQGGGWTKAVTAGNDDKSAEVWIREVTNDNVGTTGQIETGGAGAVHAGILVYKGLAEVTNSAKVTQCNTIPIAIRNNGSGPYLVIAASDNDTPESSNAMFHFSPGDDRVFIYLTEQQNFTDGATGSLRGAIASLSLADKVPKALNSSIVAVEGLPSELIHGESASVNITVKNTGTDSWSKADNIDFASANGDASFGASALSLDDNETIASGESRTFSFKLKSPETEGIYPFEWQMRKDGNAAFGNSTGEEVILVFDGTEGKLIDPCESANGWNGGISLSDKEVVGSSSLQTTVSTELEFQKKFTTPINTGMSAENAVLRFYYYVSDVSKMTGVNQVELGSGGAPDVNEYNWSLPTDLKDGWNIVKLKLSEARSLGAVDMSAINWFRIYNFKNGVITTRLDQVVLIDPEAASSTIKTNVWTGKIDQASWEDINNWNGGRVPDQYTKVVFNQSETSEAQITDSRQIHQLVQGDNGLGGAIRIGDQGALKTSSIWSAVGYNNAASLTVEQGGEATFGGHLWVGFTSSGNGQLTLNGGQIKVSGAFALGFESTAKGSCTINSGTLRLAELGASRISDGSKIEIGSGGKIRINGNVLTIVQGYIDAGKIVALANGTITTLLENDSTTISYVAPSAADITWIGPSGGNWFISSNWSSGTVPTNIDNVMVPAANEVNIDADASLNDLTLEDGATLIVGSESTLKIYGDLVATTGKLRVSSGSSLITHGTVSGEMHEIIRETTFTEGRYSAIGSPVAGATTDILGSLIYAYDESVTYIGGQERFRKVVTPELMAAGDAYFSAFTGTVTFTGSPNTGNITSPISNPGFNLISNPYAAAISFDQFIAANTSSFDGTIYLWDDGGSDQDQRGNADYIVVNSMGSVSQGASRAGDWNGFIGSAQGFMVNATDDMVFTNAMRVDGQNTKSSYFRNASEFVTIKLNLKDESGYTYETLIGFGNQATAGLDVGLDAKQHSFSLTKFHSLLENQPLAIQALPLDGPLKVDLGFEVASVGDYAISLEEAVGLESNQEIVLHDRELNKSLILSESNPRYLFSSSIKKNDNRFELEVRLAPEIQVILGQSVLHLFSDRQMDNTSISIMDITGRLLSQFEINKPWTNYDLPVSLDTNKIYVVQITDMKRTYSYKFSIR